MKTVIITGVSRGLGESLALDLLKRGFSVVGVGRANSARLLGEHYRFVPCDLADAADVDTKLTAPFRTIASERPAAVCLINNAATAGPAGVLGQLDARSLTESLAVNLIAPVAVANLFCKVFDDTSIERRIINISSGAAQSAITGGGAYSIAKAGLEMLTKQLTAEQQAPNFRAITVRPGVIDTGMQTFMRSQPPEVLPSVGMFQGFHQGGQLVAPGVVAAKIVDNLLLRDVDPGRTYVYKEL